MKEGGFLSLPDLLLLLPARCGVSEEPSPAVPFLLANIHPAMHPSKPVGELSMGEMAGMLAGMDVVTLQCAGASNTQSLCGASLQRVVCVVAHNRTLGWTLLSRNRAGTGRVQF